MYNVRACACVIKLIEMCLLNKNCFSAIMEKFFKTPTKTSTKKRKRSINPLFIDVSIIDVCHSYASSHNIIFNCQKILGLSFVSSNFKLNIKPNVVLGDFKIQFVNEIKYLGIS